MGNAGVFLVSGVSLAVGEEEEEEEEEDLVAVVVMVVVVRVVAEVEVIFGVVGGGRMPSIGVGFEMVVVVSYVLVLGCVVKLGIVWVPPRTVSVPLDEGGKLVVAAEVTGIIVGFWGGPRVPSSLGGLEMGALDSVVVVVLGCAVVVATVSHGVRLIA